MSATSASAATRRKTTLTSLKGAVFHPDTKAVLIAPILLIIAIFISGFLVGHVDTPYLLRCWDIFAHTLREAAPIIFLGLGAGIVLATGGVDLSAASVAAVGGLVFGYSLIWLNSPFVALLVAVLAGFLLGSALGILVAFRWPPLIVSWTLAIIWMSAAISFSIYAKENAFIGWDVGVLTLPLDFRWLRNYAESKAFLKHLIYIILALLILAALTNFFRRCRAVGANIDSARYCGIEPRKVYVYAYAITGGMSAIAGVLVALRGASVSLSSFAPFTLTGIAVAVLGGTSVAGGYLNLTSIVCAACLWKLFQSSTIVQSFFSNNQYDQHVINIAFALLVLFAAALSPRLPGLIQVLVPGRTGNK
jgi:ribose transport system permease protein